MQREQSTRTEWLLVGVWVLMLFALFYALAIDDMQLFLGLAGAASLLGAISYIVVSRRETQRSPV
jgi:hypothetical protein